MKNQGRFKPAIGDEFGGREGRQVVMVVGHNVVFHVFGFKNSTLALFRAGETCEGEVSLWVGFSSSAHVVLFLDLLKTIQKQWTTRLVR